ncbi:MAG TPA: hypothetical protein VMS32_11230 [Verrucomicrobiae bacterium]|nr:hypothetical protein [Verrucomicrobiae bacterium]
MRSSVCSLLTLALALSSYGHARAADSLGIAACTVVAVQMMDDIDSSQAQPGDFFRFETINAVTRGTRIVIPARTMGYGVVAVASPAGRGGRAGTLVLEPRYFVLPNHRHLGVVLDHNASDMQRSGATNNAPGYLGAIPVPGVGAAIGIFNFLHNGKNIEVKKGTVFVVFPSDDPSVEDCQTHPNY